MNLLMTTTDSPVVRQTTLGELTDYVILKHKGYARWERDKLRNWIGAMSEQGFVIALYDDTGIIGVSIARPIMKREQSLDLACFDMEGPIIYVDAIVFDSNYAMRCLVIAMIKRFGRRQFVAWRRGTGDSRLHFYLASTVVRKILKKEE